MKAVIITQEEPFYLPVFMSKILAEYKQVIAVFIVPGLPKGITFLSYMKRIYGIFGFRDFLVYGAVFFHHKVADLLSRFKQSKRLYSVKSVALRNSIPVYKLRNINEPNSLSFLKTLAPEIIISVACPQIFKKELISIAKHCINIHAALLPENRGRMPSFWALAKGETRTGVTVHYIDEKIDTGAIIVQKTINISPKETLYSLQNKVANTGAMALLEALDKIEKGDTVGIPQKGGGSYYSFPTKEAARAFRARGHRII